MIVYVGGVCVGNLLTQQPTIERDGIYYKIKLSSIETSLMRGYRDIILVLDDPQGFGNKKSIIGGILFEKFQNDFTSSSKNNGYNLLIELSINESIITSNIELLNAIKGEKGDPFVYSDFTQSQLNYLKGEKGDPFEYEDFTEQQLLSLKGEDGYTPQKGIDYEDGEDGYTPVKDVDYFDGNDGLDGRGEVSRELISTVGLIKTYRITYTDSTTFEYSVSDGGKGDKGDDFEYSDFTPEQLAAIKGDTGKSAYQSYVDTTTDNPPVSEAVWAAINTIVLQLKIQSDITTLTTGDGKYIYTVPEKLNNYNLTAIHAALTTVSSSGLPSFQVYNLTDSVDILSTNVTIDAGEYNSYTALTQPVINAANRNVVTGDRLRFDVDGAGTSAKGWSMILTFTKA